MAAARRGRAQACRILAALLLIRGAWATDPEPTTAAPAEETDHQVTCPRQTSWPSGQADCPHSSWLFDASSRTCLKAVGLGSHSACSQSICGAHGAALVTLTTGTKKTFVTSEVMANDSWTGGFFYGGHSMLWSSGCSPTQADAGSLAPPARSECGRCLKLKAEGATGTTASPQKADCSLELPCLCEYPGISSSGYRTQVGKLIEEDDLACGLDPSAAAALYTIVWLCCCCGCCMSTSIILYTCCGMGGRQPRGPEGRVMDVHSSHIREVYPQQAWVDASAAQGTTCVGGTAVTVGRPVSNSLQQMQPRGSSRHPAVLQARVVS